MVLLNATVKIHNVIHYK